jgi:hypothetical protein
MLRTLAFKTSIKYTQLLDFAPAASGAYTTLLRIESLEQARVQSKVDHT